MIVFRKNGIIFILVKIKNKIKNYKTHKNMSKINKEINWDFLMLTMLDGGDLDIADTLSHQSEEYRMKLINIINKSKIFNLQEFVFGYVCGSVYGTNIKLKNNNIK